MTKKTTNDEEFLKEMAEKLKKDEYGLYKNTPNYKKIRASIDKIKKK